MNESGEGQLVAMSSAEPAVLLSHPTGNQNVRNALLALVENDMLAEFWTAIAWDPDSRWNRLLPSALRSLLARRTFPEAPSEKIRSCPWKETVRLCARSSPLERLLSTGERPFSVVAMYRHFDAKVARRLREVKVDLVYAYEGGALRTFRESRRQGVRTLYDLTSGYWYWERNLLSEEKERNPQLANVIPKLLDSEAHMQEKDEELRLADLVIVASRHVARTLAGVVPDEKIRVIPYGAPPVLSRPLRRTPNGRPLQVLFAGALHQRKGIGYLLEAIAMMGSAVQLTMIGEKFAANHLVDDACERWRWFKSIPHGQVLKIMMESDVLVLPSLSEGFGLVVTEALACGLPVIVTPNVGANDLVCDGRDGFVVPICSAEAIAGKLNALDKDRDLLAQMSQNAQKTAAECTWEHYRRTLAETVKEASWR